MSSYKQDPRIDKYIDTLPDWQQAICHKVREVAHAADPALEETVKRSVLPFFVLDGNVCALSTAKDHLNIFIYDPIAPDPKRLINQGKGNKTARSIQVYEKDALDEDALSNLLKAVIANNRAGGWRKVLKK